MTVRGAAVFAAAACVALGTWAARRLNVRESVLEEWASALKRMENALAFDGAALPQVLRAGADNHLPTLQALINRMEEAPAQSIDELLNDLPWDPLLTDSEKDVLNQCLKALFSPSPIQQSQALARAQEQWQEFLKSAKAVREKNGRLYVSLGWLGGAALFIFLC